LNELRQNATSRLELADYRDEVGFKELLIGKLGMVNACRQFHLAVSEFWDMVREPNTHREDDSRLLSTKRSPLA
jgi:hypothetical protein